MTGEVRSGIVALMIVVVAVIAWLALRPAPRHDGVTRAQLEASTLRLRTGDHRPVVRRVGCKPERGHWHCRALFTSGRITEWQTGRRPRPAAIAFFTS